MPLQVRQLVRQARQVRVQALVQHLQVQAHLVRLAPVLAQVLLVKLWETLILAV